MPEHGQPERPVVDEVVGERPEPGVAQVADHRDVRDEQQRDDEQPRPAVDAVQGETGDERGDRLEAQPDSGSRAGPRRWMVVAAGSCVAIMVGLLRAA